MPVTSYEIIPFEETFGTTTGGVEIDSPPLLLSSNTKLLAVALIFLFIILIVSIVVNSPTAILVLASTSNMATFSGLVKSLFDDKQKQYAEAALERREAARETALERREAARETALERREAALERRHGETQSLLMRIFLRKQEPEEPDIFDDVLTIENID